MLEKVFVKHGLEKNDPDTNKIMTRQPSEQASEKSWRNLVHTATHNNRNAHFSESSSEGRQKYMCFGVGLSLILSVINVIFSTTAIALSVCNFNKNPDTSNQTILVQTETSKDAQTACRNQRHVEFIMDDQGNRIPSGSRVSDEWLDGYGFVVHSDASSAPIVWHTSEYDVPGLYLPIVDSNVIALSDKTTSLGIPKMDAGGTIIFDFVQQDVTLLEIGLLNVNQDIQITTIDRSGQKVSETFRKLGAGSVATVEMQQRSNIVSLNVQTQGPTAVTYITYCWN
jgi:hypothetical protein